MPKIINEKKLVEEVKMVISQIAEIEVEKITPDANFVEDLGMDSMMALEILAFLEKTYKIKIPESYLKKLVNLQQVINIIHEFI